MCGDKFLHKDSGLPRAPSGTAAVEHRLAKSHKLKEKSLLGYAVLIDKMRRRIFGSPIDMFFICSYVGTMELGHRHCV